MSPAEKIVWICIAFVIAASGIGVTIWGMVRAVKMEKEKMKQKNLSLDDIKTLTDRHGFVLMFSREGKSADADKFADVVNETMKEHKLTAANIAFYSKLVFDTIEAFVFVYPPNVQFASGDFYQMANRPGMPWKADTLASFIKNT